MSENLTSQGLFFHDEYPPEILTIFRNIVATCFEPHLSLGLFVSLNALAGLTGCSGFPGSLSTSAHAPVPLGGFRAVRLGTEPRGPALPHLHQPRDRGFSALLTTIAQLLLRLILPLVFPCETLSLRCRSLFPNPLLSSLGSQRCPRACRTPWRPRTDGRKGE